MSMTIEIELNNIHPDTDVDTIISYLSALLMEQTNSTVIPNVIETDFADPIKMAKLLRLKPSMPGDI